MAAEAGNRYEFRTFLSAHDLPADPLPGLAPAGDPEPPRRDIYLLSPGEPRLLPKLRGGERFEVKRLAALADRLEEWEVVVSAAFPLDDEALVLAGRLFGRPPGRAALDGASADAFLESLGGHEADAIVVPVEKRRRRFSADPLLGEVTDLILPSEDTRLATVAVESADLAALAAFLETAPFVGLPNLNYGAFLRWYARTGVPPVSHPRRHGPAPAAAP